MQFGEEDFDGSQRMRSLDVYPRTCGEKDGGRGHRRPHGPQRRVERRHAEPAQDTVAGFTELSQQVEQLAKTHRNSARLDLDKKLQLLSEADRNRAMIWGRALDPIKAQLATYQGAADN